MYSYKLVPASWSNFNNVVSPRTRKKQLYIVTSDVNNTAVCFHMFKRGLEFDANFYVHKDEGKWLYVYIAPTNIQFNSGCVHMEVNEQKVEVEGHLLRIGDDITMTGIFNKKINFNDKDIHEALSDRISNLADSLFTNFFLPDLKYQYIARYSTKYWSDASNKVLDVLRDDELEWERYEIYPRRIRITPTDAILYAGYILDNKEAANWLAHTKTQFKNYLRKKNEKATTSEPWIWVDTYEQYCAIIADKTDRAIKSEDKTKINAFVKSLNATVSKAAE